MASINAAIHRLLSLPLSIQAQNKEITTIQNIARTNQVDVDVATMVRRKRLKHLLAEANPDPPPLEDSTRVRWIRLPYLGKSSNVLARELRKYNYHVGFYPLTTVGHLIKLKDRIPTEKQSGVYKLSCGECEALYIGQTGRAFKTRFGEHRTAFNKNKPEDSAMAKYCINQRHNFNTVSGKLIHATSKSILLNRFEEIETIRASKVSGTNLLNDLDATFFNSFLRYYYEFSPPNPSTP